MVLDGWKKDKNVVFHVLCGIRYLNKPTYLNKSTLGVKKMRFMFSQDVVQNNANLSKMLQKFEKMSNQVKN